MYFFQNLLYFFCVFIQTVSWCMRRSWKGPSFFWVETVEIQFLIDREICQSELIHNLELITVIP